jgi:cysteinyl-tRNA synthetase
MTLKLYDTLKRQRVPFNPIIPGKVSFYVCGVTVYDHCHMGHARAYVAFDIIRRYLTHSGFQVQYIQNFTDIDDKIIQKAHDNNESVETVVSRNIDSYFEDMAALGILKANQYPRATQYIDAIITIIKGLIDKGYAYITAASDVCFSIDAFSNYGNLSKKVIDELESGSRVVADQAKKNPLDFVLWKPSKPDEPAWVSPWGKGRPGWHIECSAMVLETLGETIDIHGGGADLIFPHHENEIAQSECYTGKLFAKYWLHNGFVTIKNEKMSKSTGNFFTIKEALKQYDGDTLRFFLLKAHYRSPLQYSETGLIEAKHALNRLKSTFQSVSNGSINANYKAEFDKISQRFHDAMSDDFNTAEAIGVLFDLNKLIHTTQSGTDILKKLGDILGIFFQLQEAPDSLSETLMALIDERNGAKKNRDFSKADEIRDTLLNQHGVIIEDTPEGTRWKHA